jgi:uncharacterized cupredoxin-like copper-binding protein
MAIGRPVTDSGDKKDEDSYHDPTSYAFNGRVVMGIGIIMGMALVITIYMGTISQSQQIHLSLNSLMPSFVSSFFSNSDNNHMPVLFQSVSPSKNVDKRIVLIQQDFGWNGTNGGPPIVVNKGDRIQLVVINRGHMAHNFGIGVLPKQVADLMDKEKNVTLEKRMEDISYDSMSAMPCPGCQKVYEQAHINLFMKPGTQQTTTFVADKPGHFNYFCMVRGHLWLGMIGDLTVRENPESTTNKNTGGLI